MKISALFLAVAAIAAGAENSATPDRVQCCGSHRSAAPVQEAALQLRPGQRQLFLDNHILESVDGITRKLHQPVKFGAVIKPDRPWEGESIQIRTGPSWDPMRRVWMAWYIRGYAESRDGEHWEKPELGVQEYKGSRANNLMLPFTEFEFKDDTGKEIKSQQGDGTTIDNVFYDPGDPDPARRYKGMGYRGPICCLTHGRGMGFYPAVSPDGRRWTLLDTAFIQSGDECHLTYDETRHLYIATVKQPGPYGRSVYLSISSDFTHWTDPRDCLIFHADATDQALGVRRVEMHMSTANLRKPVFHNPEEFVTDIYNLAVVPYEGIYIGLPTVFNHSGDTAHNSDGFSMVELAVSRDLIHWERAGNREKFIPLSTLAGDDTYDTAQLLAADRPIITSKEIWFYYSGLKWRVRPTDLKTPDPGGNAAICLSKLRRDGFLSLDAGEKPGTVLTKPFILEGKALHVNVDAAGGELRAELLDARTNQPVHGFSQADSVAIGADEHDAGVAWRHAALASIAGKTVRLRFVLRKASLYSFWFDGPKANSN